MLKKIVIRNFKGYRDFRLEFNPGLNLLVGNNDTGKSTILQAINLAMTMRLQGRLLSAELSPYLFNQESVAEYLTALREGRNPDLPEIVVDLFLEPSDQTSRLRGSNNSLREDSPGIRVRAHFNEEYSAEYQELIADPTKIRTLPTEYYSVEWHDFAGNAISPRGLAPTASLIDSTMIRLQSGADYYLQGLINEHLDERQRVELALAYRSLQETFADHGSIVSINSMLNGATGEISDRQLSMSIDATQRAGWENGVVPHLDALPFQFVGSGEQSSLKILLALKRRADDSHVILIEEPENHLSFASLNKLLSKIKAKYEGKQLIVTTHSSYVLNKLGLASLVLLENHNAVKLSDLQTDTQDYFMKLSGYDTLRLVLADRAILVEGPSDELVVQRAYRDAHEDRLPIQDGVDVISVRGLSFRRFLEIAALLGKTVSVVTDNDGKPEDVRDKYQDFDAIPTIAIHFSDDASLKTLEPQMLDSIGHETMRAILGRGDETSDETLSYMKNNKTTTALKLFEHVGDLTWPEYIRDAIA